MSDFTRHLALGIWLRMAVLAGIIWAFAWRRGARPAAHQADGYQIGRVAAFFFALAFAGSLPILVSPVLAGHYFFPSIAFFALGFAALAEPATRAFRPRSGGRAWRAPVWIAAALAAAVVLVLSIHGPVERRDTELVGSLYALEPGLRKGGIVGACPASAEDWGLVNYLQRFYRVSVIADGSPQDGRFLMASGGCAAPPNCVTSIQTARVVLLQCAP
jgi:hypothetical protein